MNASLNQDIYISFGHSESDDKTLLRNSPRLALRS